MKPTCSENGSGNLAWTLEGQCKKDGTDYPYMPLTDSSEGCPGEYDSSNDYEAGDMVEDNQVVYTCSGAAAFCNLNAPNLRSVGVHYWKPTNSCTGTANPTASPVFDNPQDGCPEEFDSSTTYEANDRVSVTQCWPDAWTYIGGCTGSYSPTATPTFDPANVEGCPEQYDDGTEYEEGDKVSVTAAGEDYGKIYECKGWPESAHCGNEAYSPLNTDKLCNGLVCWPDVWTYVGGCIGTITPTATPTFDEDGITGCPEEYETGAKYGENDIVSIKGTGETFESLSKWVKEGCPPEYVPNNSAYMPEDYVSVSKNEDNTYGVVWQCKNAMTAPWCQQEGYAPGTQNGDQAWEKVGHCDGTISPTVSPTMLASNPNPIKRVCQFKYKLDTTSDGEYIVLQAGSWEKGGTSFATVTGGAPFDLFKAGHVVRDGTDARKCNRWPFTPYCNQFSPFVRDASDYNPILSRKGWDKVTCENVVSVVDDVTGIEDEFNPAIPGPVFASNGHLLVKKDGTCVNLAINPEDYFKSSPAVKGCQKCATDNGFGSSADLLCTPCQGGATSKIVDGKSQCVLSNGATSSGEPSASPSTSGVPSNQASYLPSNVPSVRPSDLPSSQPSFSPSGSVQPSSEPSLNPSFSTNPTSEPSSEPSSQPSSQPSLSPSGSVQPSSEPSLNPSFSTNPTSEPSSEPSSQPSSQPSDLPSNVPSDSDQPSDLPSLSPSTVLTSSYEYVGVGRCTGSGGFYDYVRFDGIVTANACAVKCNDCVAGNVSGGEFRGFVIRHDIHQRCLCVIDNDASYTGSCAATSVNGSWSGVGPITGSYMSATAFDCYKIKA
ncbi:hypothetical protein QTG54_015762 [Skeletonema marinoi]|uniref:Circumsporozoite protein n=1 Tax=Skeletonema marinoi TaxID=267567 RepID=A0AAD9D5C8_9STRA|nr:hypothetical protein QTG54_015762 [Skeletonema marinoi]